MAYTPTQKQVQDMVNQAMKDRAPLMYAELKANGQLAKVLQDRASQFQEQVFRADDQSCDRVNRSDLGFEEKVQEREADHRRAVEAALAQATEFEDESRNRFDQRRA